MVSKSWNALWDKKNKKNKDQLLIISLKPFLDLIYLEGDGSGDMCLAKPCKNHGVCVQLKYGGYR